jgi:hypothetical protein
MNNSASKVFRRPQRLALVVLCVSAATSFGLAPRAHSLDARGGCPPLSEAASLPLRPGGGQLRGDIDGDRKTDEVSIRYDPASRASCGFVLVVETTAGRTLAVRIPEWYKPPQDLAIRSWPWPEPYLAAIVQLAPQRAQIVVARSHSASNANVSLYGLVDRRLSELRFSPRLHQNELSLFGSVGTGTTNIRCARGGPLIVLGQGPTSATGKRWFASREVYRFALGAIRRVRTQTVVSTASNADRTAHRWGFAAAPFTGCTVSRGKRL